MKHIKFPVALRSAAGAALLGASLAISNAALAQSTDITVGGDARAYAMGGAGIALLEDIGGARINPASIAFEARRIGYRFPTFGVRATNDLSLSRISSYFLSGQLNSTSNTNEIARSFKGDDSEFGFNGDTAIRFANVEISGSAVAKGKLLPNAALKTWIQNCRLGDLETQAPDARADVIATGYYNLPAVSAGFLLPQAKTSKEIYAVGVRAKVMHAYYAHYFANAAALDGNTDVLAAPELGDKSYLDKKGFGADIGFMMRPQASKGGTLSAGAIITNAINPNFKFHGTDRNGAPTTYDILKTTASAGVAYQKKNITLVADLVDITGAVGTVQFRSGAEVVLPFKLAVRGGYSSANGFTYGFGFFGMNVALGKHQPLEIARSLNF